MIYNFHDTIPSPPPIETIPPLETIHDNPVVDNTIPAPPDAYIQSPLITKPNTNIPFLMLVISAVATLISIFYCCQ